MNATAQQHIHTKQNKPNQMFIKQLIKTVSTTGCAAFLGGISLHTQADVIGVKASASAWQAQVQSAAEHLPRKTSAMLSLAVEHPVPLLPNAKLRYTALEHNQNSNNNLQEIQLQQTDAILYYELLDNIIQVDAGLAANQLNGEQRRMQSTEKFAQTRPSAYVAVAAKLPFTGWRVQSEALYGNSFGTELRDLQAEIQYDVIDNPVLDIGAKIGYRQLQVSFSQNRLAGATLEFTGPYVGVDLHF